tara:strand:+ start:1792 stop:1977 length:186 start_codon:yes stop_codon:yes gene_type:complete
MSKEKDPLMNPSENINKWEKDLAGKGSKRRPTNEDNYRDNYDKIFGNKNNKKKEASKNEQN